MFVFRCSMGVVQGWHCLSPLTVFSFSFSVSSIALKRWGRRRPQGLPCSALPPFLIGAPAKHKSRVSVVSGRSLQSPTCVRAVADHLLEARYARA